MRTIILALVVFAAPLFSLSAQDSEGVKVLVKKKIDIIIDHLKNTGLEKEVRDKKIIDEVVPMFDFPLMARLSLGKTYWKKMSKAQQGEFSELFVARLKESYLQKLDLYTDEKVTVDEAKVVKKRIHVLTHLVSVDDKKEMIYKFYKTKNGWKVYDVEVLGVSIVQTYRSQFHGILKEGSIEALLEKMKTQGAFKIS